VGSLYRPTYVDRHGEKRTSAVWWASFYANGQRVFESTQTRDRGQAKNYLKRREGEVGKDVPIVRGQQTVKFQQLADDLLNDQQANGLRSRVGTGIHLRLHILPALGHMKASAITPIEIRAYVARRQGEGAANATVNRELAAIRRAFSLALEAGRISHKPGIQMLKEDNAQKGFFELEQFEAVCAHLPEHMRPVATFAYLTGWRRNEILGLQWPQIDFENRIVRLYTSKNGEGRVFPFTPELAAVLLEQRVKADSLKAKGIITPWVFFHCSRQRGQEPREGMPIVEFKRSWKTACRAAGVPGRIFHDFRRTAVRNFVRAGIPERVAMQLSGHKGRSVFERYNIVSEGDMLLAAERLATFTADNAKKIKTAVKVRQISEAS